MYRFQWHQPKDCGVEADEALLLDFHKAFNKVFGDTPLFMLSAGGVATWTDLWELKKRSVPQAQPPNSGRWACPIVLGDFNSAIIETY